MGGPQDQLLPGGDGPVGGVRPRERLFTQDDDDGVDGGVHRLDPRRCASTTSRQDAFRDRIAAASSTALSCHSSVAMTVIGAPAGPYGTAW